MARDIELDRLKAVQEVAFKQKQVAYQKQEGTWSRLVGLKDELNRAFEEKQRAYKLQNESWEDCQELRSRKGPRIDRLNALQEEAYQNMKRSFDSASAAHERRDGASAKSYSEQGHRYKEEAQDYVAERRELVGELKTAQAIHNDTKPAFNYAKEKFAEVKRKHDESKAEHERAQEEFKRAKSNFDQAATDFKKRLEFLKNEQSLHHEKERRLAERAGVPHQYLDSVKVDYSPDGGINFFFGGVGEPDGLGHGHYAANKSGKVIYQREPFDTHGPQNYLYSDNPRFPCRDNGFIEPCTYRGKNAFKESGVDKDSGRLTIDVYYGGSGGHPLGAGHGHDVFFQDDPTELVYHRDPKKT